MSRLVFISYNFKDDREFAHNIVQFFQPRGPCHGSPRFVESVLSRDSATIDRELRRTMDGCVAAVFVCGANVHNSPWINREAELATSNGLGIVALRAPGTTGGIPLALKESRVEPAIVDWGSADLCHEPNRIVSRRTSWTGRV